LLLLGCLLAGCAHRSPSGPASGKAAGSGDPAFYRLADEFIAGYLAWRPQSGTALGLHAYDGRVTDFSRGSIEAEHARLQSFDRRLEQLTVSALGEQARYDLRILRAAIRKELFKFEERDVYRQNPMTYAGALNVNIYIKRDFAPPPQRVL